MALHYITEGHSWNLRFAMANPTVTKSKTHYIAIACENKYKISSDTRGMRLHNQKGID